MGPDTALYGVYRLQWDPPYTTDMGNFELMNCTVVDGFNRQYLQATDPGWMLKDVTMQLIVHNQFGCKKSVQANTTDVNVVAKCLQK